MAVNAGRLWITKRAAHGLFLPLLAGRGDESACKRGSVVEILHAVAIHLSGLPGDIGRAARLLFDLAPGGVYRAGSVAGSAGALLPHRFILACSPKGHRRSVFCGTFLRVTPTHC